MTGLIASVLMLLGCALALIAGIGVVRMPDMFSRMQASSKASSLGMGLAALAAAIYFHDVQVTSRALLIIVFTLLTAPVAAHVIARSAYLVKVQLWEGTIVDEWRDSIAASHEPDGEEGDSSSRGDAPA